MGSLLFWLELSIDSKWSNWINRTKALEQKSSHASDPPKNMIMASVNEDAWDWYSEALQIYGNRRPIEDVSENTVKDVIACLKSGVR